MLVTVALVLLVVWELAMIGSFTKGGFIHLLPVAALVAVIAQLAQALRSTRN